MTTTATTKGATNNAANDLSLSDSWTITITTKPPNEPVTVLNQLNLSGITELFSNSNGLPLAIPYLSFGGTISAVLPGTNIVFQSAPVSGMYTTAGVITLIFYMFESLYILTGNSSDGETIIGNVYINDPTDEGSWTGTAQGGNPNTTSIADTLLGKGLLEEQNTQVLKSSPATV